MTENPYKSPEAESAALVRRGPQLAAAVLALLLVIGSLIWALETGIATLPSSPIEVQISDIPDENEEVPWESYPPSQR